MTEKSKLDHALEIAALGLPVFPLDPDGKTPAIDGWRKKASTDPEKVKSFWTDPVTGWEQDWNIGVATGGGIVVLDEDNKHEKRGRDSVTILEMTYDTLPPTLTGRTPTGGRHYIFRTDTPAKNSVGRIGEGLDVRGEGGYIVGPGSTIGGAAYEWERGPDGHQIAPAPSWLTDLMRQARPREPRKETTAVDRLDSEAAIRRATRYLTQEAPIAVEGDGGDLTTYQVAARVKDFGLTAETTFDLMAEHWNEHCAPPWPLEDLRRKVENAYRYGERPVGALSPEAEFDPVDQGDAGKPKQPQRLYFKLPRDIKPDLDKAALIEDLIDPQAMSVLYGESNSGKTFVALDMAYHVATGKPWHGKRTEQGAVVYVAAEGGKGAEARVEALKRAYGVDDFPLALVPCPVDLLHPKADTKPLIELIGQVEAQLGPVALVVIDTLSRALAGGNENASDDMGALVKNLDRIRVSTGAHLLVVHHSGKDKARGARGHSLLRAATDTEIEVADRVISVTKQRDMDYARPMAFDLKVVELGTNAHGKAITSCVVVPVDLSARAEFGREKPSGTAQKALEVLERLQAVKAAEAVSGERGAGGAKDAKDAEGMGAAVAAGGFHGYWIEADAWRDAFVAGGGYAGDSGRVTFARARKKLLSMGWIEENENGSLCRCLS